jgi:hypothetical protein
MTGKKVLVSVSASFENKEDLFKTLKKYSPYNDEHFAYWGEFAFTTEIMPDCDAILVLNTPHETIRTFCDPQKVIAFMMEPGVKKIHPWMFKRLDQYSRVYSPIEQSKNTIRSHGFLGWYFEQDYNYLNSLKVPEKPRLISCIASNLSQLKGQQLRVNFVNKLKKELHQIEFFGKGSHFLTDKMKGLLPYRYSISIENTSAPDYFTEKINDCFLTYTVPIYYGCRNINRYFPEKSFIQINIEKPDIAIEKIRSVLNEDDWNSRFEAVCEARHLVLEKYQPLAGAAHVLRQIQSGSEKRIIVLKPVKIHPLKRILSSFYKLVNQNDFFKLHRLIL